MNLKESQNSLPMLFKAWTTLVLLFSISALAQSGPSNLNVSGVLYSSTGDVINNPSVNFKLEVWDKAATCILYSEEHLSENLSTSKGNFSLALGKGSSINNYLESSSVMTAKVFENSGAVAGGWTGCASGTTLSSGDERLIRLYYDLGGGYVAMNPDVPLASSAYAMVAQTLQGKAASDFVQLRDDASYDLNQANVENVFSSTNYARLLQLLNPSAALGFGSQRLTNLADPTSAQDASTKNYSDSNLAGKNIDLSDVGSGTGGGKVLMWDQSQNKWVASAPSFGGPAGGDLTGTYPNPTVAALAIGTSKLADSAVTSAKINSTGISTNRILITDGITGSTVTYKACANDEVLKFVTGTGWACATVASLAPVTSVNGKTGAVTLNAADLSLGTAALKDYGTAAGNLVELDAGAKIPTALLPNLAGDVTGAPATNVVTAIQGRAVASTAPNDNEVLKWNQAQTRWEPAAISSYAITALTGDVTASGTGSVTATIGNGKVTTAKLFTNPGVNRLVATDSSTGATLSAFSCSLNQIMQWGASGWACQDVSSVMTGAGDFKADGSVPMTGNLRLNGNFLSGDGGSEGVFVDSSGNVGVGTTSPAALLNVEGSASPNALFTRTTGAQSSQMTAARLKAKTSVSSIFDGFGTGLSFAIETASMPETYSGSIGYIRDGADNSSKFVVNNTAAGVTKTPFVISANGNVGIGTTSPSRLLEVTGPMRITPATLPSSPAAGDLAFDSGAANALKFYDGSSWQTVGTGTGSGDFKADGSVPMTGNLRLNGKFLSGDGGNEGVFVDANGNVGVGTTAPLSSLHVVSNGVADGRNYIDAYGGTAALPGFVTRGARGTASAPSALMLGDSLGYWAARGYGATAFGSGSRATIGMFASENWTDSAQGTFITFTTTQTGSTNGPERLRIDPSGNVGIGTSSPTYKLDVAGTIRSSSGGIMFPDGTTQTTAAGGGGSGQWGYSNPNLYYMAGSVGIGTTTPAYKLHIADSGSNPILKVEGTGTYGPQLILTSTDTGGHEYRIISTGTSNTTGAGAFRINDSTAGQDRFIINSTGNVGIGITNPVAPLDISTASTGVLQRITSTTGAALIGIQSPAGNTSGISLRRNVAGGNRWQMATDLISETGSNSGSNFIIEGFDDSGNSLGKYVYISRSSGNVGIGTTSPARLLHVAGPVRISPAALPSSPAAGDLAFDSGAANALKFYDGSSWQTVGTGSGSGDFKADGSVPMTGNLRLNGNFLSGDGGNEGVFVDASGNVGIGTTAPVATTAGRTYTSIKGSSNAGALELLSGAADADGNLTGILQFSDTNGTNAEKRVAYVSANLMGSTATKRGGSLSFGTKGDSAGVFTRMLIDNVGNVGIGTTSPNYKLDVLASPGWLAQISDGTASARFWSTAGVMSLGSARVGDDWRFFVDNNSSLGLSIKSGTGNVGIGTTTPSYKLDVAGTIRSSSGGIMFPDGTTQTTAAGGGGAGQWSYSNPNIYYTAGNVGIGTTSPASRLSVSGGATIGSSYATTAAPTDGLAVEGKLLMGSTTAYISNSGTVSPNLQIHGLGVSNSSLMLTNWANDNTKYPTFFIGKSSGNAIGTHAVVADGETTGNLQFTYSDGAGFKVASAIVAKVDGTASAGSTPGSLSFSTNSGSGTYDRLVIRASGNIGVGTSTPSSLLDIYGGELTVRKNSAATSVVIDPDLDVTSLNPGTTTRAGMIRGPANQHLVLDLRNNDVQDSIAFRYSAANSGVVDTIGLVMKGNGNVGIGTTSPSYKLDVAGTIRSSSGGIMFPDGTTQTTAAGGGGAGQWGYSNPNVYYNAGSVGVGTSTPNRKIEIYQTDSNNAQLRLTSVPSVAGTSYESALEFYTAATSGAAGLLSGRITSNFLGASYTNTVLKLQNVTTGGVLVDTMTLNNGKVGIGTTSPGSILHLSSNTPIISLADTATSTVNTVANNTGALSFNTSGANSIIFNLGGVEKMRLLANTGYLGVGTTTPSSKLTLVSSTDNSAADVQTDTNGLDVFTTSSTANNFAMIRLGSWGSGSLSSMDGNYIRSIASANNVVDLALGRFDSTASMAEFMRITNAGRVGIGTTTPRSTLDVNGAVVGKPATSNSTTTVNFGLGNLQYTSLACQTFDLWNMKDGASYTLAIQNTTAATCAFNAYSDSGSTALTFHLPPDHAATQSGKHTIYTFVVLGSHVYASWITGY